MKNISAVWVYTLLVQQVLRFPSLLRTSTCINMLCEFRRPSGAGTDDGVELRA